MLNAAKGATTTPFSQDWMANDPDNCTFARARTVSGIAMEVMPMSWAG